MITNYFKRKALSNSEIQRGNTEYKEFKTQHTEIGGLLDAMLTSPDNIDTFLNLYFDDAKDSWLGYDPQNYELAYKMYQSVMSSQIWQKLLSLNLTFQKDYAAYWCLDTKQIVFERTTNCIATKGLVDFEINDLLMGDIKTHNCSSKEEFLKKISSAKYHQQGVWYLNHNPKVKKFLYVGVSKINFEVYTYIIERDSQTYFTTQNQIIKKIEKLNIETINKYRV